jgi:predicted LPLAT superfamily acyltransferase
MHLALLILKIIGITVGAVVLLAIVGVLIAFGLATRNGGNPFQ